MISMTTLLVLRLICLIAFESHGYSSQIVSSVADLPNTIIVEGLKGINAIAMQMLEMSQNLNRIMGIGSKNEQKQNPHESIVKFLNSPYQGDPAVPYRELQSS